MSPRDVFECLAYNLDPSTGQLLRPKAKEGDRVGMDFTFNATKSVSIARELAGPGNEGDPRIEAAHREAIAYAMKHIEADMQARVRVGGANDNRTTGNLVAYRVTHRDTRINADDQHPDPQLHDHFFVLNLTYDPVEEKFKAAELGRIKHDAPWFEAICHNRLAHNLQNLGYGIRRKDKSFEISGIDDDLAKKFSRRSEYIKMVAGKLGITNPETRAKLGATTRLGKSKELSDDLNGYYVSRLTGGEKGKLGNLQGQPTYKSSEEKAVRFAIEHLFERQSVVEERKLYETAIRHGIGSVTPEGVTAECRRQGVLLKDGEATTKNVLAEEQKIIQYAREGKGACGVMGSGPDRTGGPLGVPNGKQAETRLGESPNNTRIMAGMQSDTATLPDSSQQKGRTEPEGTMRPLALQSNGGLTLNERSKQVDTATPSPERQPLSAGYQLAHVRKGIGDHIADPSNKVGLSEEQQAMVSHVLNSTDRVILVIGDAGTGKTHSIRETFSRIDKPIEMLAPSSDASRGVLRKEGFSKADTVASFLNSNERQRNVKNGVIWIDEAGLLPIKDLSRLTDIAKEQNARLVLQGDPKQHKSVVRHGNMMNVLQEYAGLPVGRLTQIWRQTHQGYKSAVADIAQGKLADGFDKLDDLGWIKRVEGNTPLVDDYFEALRTKKANQSEQDRAIIVAPTHIEGQEITSEIRQRLKEQGKLGEDKTFDQLIPLNRSIAEQGDLQRYDGTETMVFHHSSGTFKAGQTVKVTEWKKGDRFKSPEHFSLYRESKLSLASGDVIRFTKNGKSLDGHQIDNGSMYKIRGFDKDQNIVLENGWTVGKGFRHFNHGYVSTSHAAQGKTTDHVLVAMGSESRGAINAEQLYVSASRGRQSAKIYTDLPLAELKHVILKTDTRKSASELMTPKPAPKPRPKKLGKVLTFMKKVKERIKRLRDRDVDVTKQQAIQKEKQYAGYER